MSKQNITTKLYEVMTPIFNKESGHRLRIARMSKLMDQRTLAALLGVSQQIVSKLETGRLEVSSFTIARLMEALPGETGFIFFGNREYEMSRRTEVRAYWDVMSQRRKPRKRKEFLSRTGGK